MTRIPLIRQAAAAVLALCLAASAAIAASPESSGNLVWPSPPLEPRIRYLSSYATPDDIGREKGFWRKLWEFIRGDEQFEKVLRPMAVTTDSQERILVADTRVKRVHVFDRRKKEYSHISQAGEETFLLPIGVAVDGRDYIYIADGERRKIFVFRPNGEFDHAIKGLNELGRPSSLAIDRGRNRLYVADVTRHQIRVIDLTTERQIAAFGKRGEERGEFNFPSHVSVAHDGRLAVTDAMNMRIQMLDSDGKPLLALGKHGDGSGDFTAPKGVALDSEGHIYVADAGFDNIQIFGGDGKLRLYWGNAGQNPGQFWMPAGIHIDAQNRIYVADSHNGRVQVFQYLGAAAKK